MKKLLFIIGLAVMAVFAGVVAPTEEAFADICSDFTAGSHQYVAAGCGNDKKAPSVAVDIINVVLGVVGVVTVIIIIVAGIMYMTSTGDAAKTVRAKNALLYSVIGLVVSLLAFAIVNFVSKGIGG